MEEFPCTEGARDGESRSTRQTSTHPFPSNSLLPSGVTVPIGQALPGSTKRLGANIVNREDGLLG